MSNNGRNYASQSFEFASAQIDEHAAIRIYTGSALSSSPAIRTKQVQELYASEMLGPRATPDTARRALKLIDADGIGEMQEENQRVEELPRRRIDKLREGATFQELVPMPWENHDIAWATLADFFMSPEFEDWGPDQKKNELMVMVWR